MRRSLIVMPKRWTPNFEQDADRVAPILAKCGSAIACALYYWLHSRMFGRESGIHVSIAWLAKQLGVSRSSVSEAVRTLAALGLIEHVGRRGNGGGSAFVVLGLTSLRDNQSSARETFDDRQTRGNEVAAGHITAASLNIINTRSNSREYHEKIERFGAYDRQPEEVSSLR